MSIIHHNRTNAPNLDQRQDALRAFALQVATLPFDIQKVRDALDVVELAGGKELALEACMTASAFEAITRAV